MKSSTPKVHSTMSNPYRMLSYCNAHAAALLTAALMVACSTNHDQDESGRLMNSGITEARSALTKTQSGVDELTAGNRGAGLTDIDTGMGMMDHGIADMHSGIGMMSSGMMMNCMDGGSSTMMNQLQKAADEMQQGHGMLADDAGSDITLGIGHMQNGMTNMSLALDQAQTSMNCMGHKDGMMGMM